MESCIREHLTEASLLSGGAVCWLRWTRAVSWGLGKRRDQRLANVHFVLTDQREQGGQLIVSETENRSLDCLDQTWT